MDNQLLTKKLAPCYYINGSLKSGPLGHPPLTLDIFTISKQLCRDYHRLREIIRIERLNKIFEADASSPKLVGDKSPRAGRDSISPAFSGKKGIEPVKLCFYFRGYPMPF